MKILRFKTFDFQAFKNAYAKRCDEKRDTRKVLENEIARANAADFVEMGLMTQEELDDMPILGESDAPVVRKTIRMTQSDTRLMEKATYLMDEVIYRSILNARNDPDATGKAIMNARIMKDVLGRDYKPILEAFTDLNYTRCDETYESSTAKAYEVLDGIEETDCPPEIERKILEYQQKTKELLTIARKEQQIRTMTRLMRQQDPGATEEQAASFLKRYTAGLNKIKIADETGLNKAIPMLKAKAEKELNDKGKPKDPESIRIYFDALARTLREDKDIYVIDTQGRMYHFLTGLKRELKDYLTIDFSLDCKNSHPLLFNYILFFSKHCGPRDAYEISSRMKDIAPLVDGMDALGEYHYVGKSIRNLLISSGLKEAPLAVFTDDELKYIYETTNGLFWDNICREHPEYDRSDIKQKMFAEVFYSNTTRLVYKEYGKMFKDRYPNVYREIVRWKTPEKYYDIQRYLDDSGVIAKKPTASLSVALMSLESRIFRSVLASLYRKRYYAVHIHDCIVIPLTGNKHQPTREEVERLLMKEYAKYGLVPTLKAD